MKSAATARGRAAERGGERAAVGPTAFGARATAGGQTRAEPAATPHRAGLDPAVPGVRIPNGLGLNSHDRVDRVGAGLGPVGLAPKGLGPAGRVRDRAPASLGPGAHGLDGIKGRSKARETIGSRPAGLNEEVLGSQAAKKVFQVVGGRQQTQDVAFRGGVVALHRGECARGAVAIGDVGSRKRK